MHASMQDAAALLAARYGAAGASATAGGAGDATEVDAAWIDRLGFASLKVAIAFTATLAEDATLSIAANLQDAPDDGAGAASTGDAADFGTALAAAVVATGGTGGSTETGVVELDIDLSAAKRHVRVQFTPDLSAAMTDTATVAAVYLLAGSTDNPVTAAA